METKIPAIAATDTKVLEIENAAEGDSAPGCSGVAPPGPGAGGDEVFGEVGDEGEGAGEEVVEGGIAGEGVGDFVEGAGAELGDNDCVGAGAANIGCDSIGDIVYFEHHPSEVILIVDDDYRSVSFSLLSCCVIFFPWT
ncbi:hypothetical protein QL285_043475 [Trifolium repens]|nr:hypothetical protein QL285_043475 [Trifolium repens]